MRPDAVTSTYRRWAPIYDATFGRVTNAGRQRAAAHVSRRGGEVLEVGVGTGLVLPLYQGGVRVTGIDYSQEMLAKAEEKVTELSLSHVEGLHRMDARSLEFPDASFDTVAAMHVLSVVPEPEKVLCEMARVCRPGGQLVIVNHFTAEAGPLRALERLSTRFEDLLGWQSDFPIERVLGHPELDVAERESLPPFGMMTWLVLDRRGC
ncbi:SAM-dependent methyltransferase [Haematobacter massiliensis]|uniref:SAM-dependent methlyltransferase n=1 Tax=Haematobacter massiliensis TaxID=195105 RepID=A0A086Y388_9RHOB|nr:class I SAM-dependent methyltransferase [Haematobacter massiliensis]KFI28738.1 SAM-dependent methlyltransferase [Haematobacter massiliensis]OWJ69584.1 SAM-dependent methyltransferase [Haematobacter massiliensis]OWJ86827.1 SAM-dependent methyltransferase [Haematobacter massiliensis]QBJ26280.1 methyltransferase domain-containing protein [Haematobacter massiliensis]